MLKVVKCAVFIFLVVSMIMAGSSVITTANHGERIYFSNSVQNSSTVTPKWAFQGAFASYSALVIQGSKVTHYIENYTILNVDPKNGSVGVVYSGSVNGVPFSNITFSGVSFSQNMGSFPTINVSNLDSLNNGTVPSVFLYERLSLNNLSEKSGVFNLGKYSIPDYIISGKTNLTGDHISETYVIEKYSGLLLGGNRSYSDIPYSNYSKYTNFTLLSTNIMQNRPTVITEPALLSGIIGTAVVGVIMVVYSIIKRRK